MGEISILENRISDLQAIFNHDLPSQYGLSKDAWAQQVKSRTNVLLDMSINNFSIYELFKTGNIIQSEVLGEDYFVQETKKDNCEDWLNFAAELAVDLQLKGKNLDLYHLFTKGNLKPADSCERIENENHVVNNNWFKICSKVADLACTSNLTYDLKHLYFKGYLKNFEDDIRKKEELSDEALVDWIKFCLNVDKVKRDNFIVDIEHLYYKGEFREYKPIEPREDNSRLEKDKWVQFAPRVVVDLFNMGIKVDLYELYFHRDLNDLNETSILERISSNDDLVDWSEFVSQLYLVAMGQDIRPDLYEICLRGSLQRKEIKERDIYKFAADHLLKNIAAQGAGFNEYALLWDDHDIRSRARERFEFMSHCLKLFKDIETEEVITLDKNFIFDLIKQVTKYQRDPIIDINQETLTIQRNVFVHLLELINNGYKAIKDNTGIVDEQLQKAGAIGKEAVGELMPMRVKIFEAYGHISYSVWNRGNEFTPDIFDGGNLYLKQLDHNAVTGLFNNGQGTALMKKDIVDNYGGVIQINSVTSQGSFSSEISSEGVRYENLNIVVEPGKNYCQVNLIVPKAN